MNKKIIFCAGGTGGHIFPAINLMKHFFEKGFDVVIVTDKRGSSFIDNRLEFKSHILNVTAPSNKNFLKKILSFILIFYSLIQSIIILKKEKADIIIGFGGYVSFPVSFASKLFNLPLIAIATTPITTTARVAAIKRTRIICIVPIFILYIKLFLNEARIHT